MSRTMREGDIFNWCYSDPTQRGLGGGDPYWCKSRIAIVDAHGRLRDTYWRASGDDFVPADKADLVFIANLSDLDKRPEYERERYADADIVNLNHSNSSRDNFYVWKGAQPCPAKMLESARYRLTKAHDDERSARWRAEHAYAEISRLRADAMLAARSTSNGG